MWHRPLTPESLWHKTEDFLRDNNRTFHHPFSILLPGCASHFQGAISGLKTSWITPPNHQRLIQLETYMSHVSTYELTRHPLNHIHLTKNCPAHSIMELPCDIFSTINFFLFFLGALVVVSAVLLWRLYPRPSDYDETGNVLKIQSLWTFKGRHETVSILSEMVDKDGTGA